jgi:hypothetical protein
MTIDKKPRQDYIMYDNRKFIRGDILNFNPPKWYVKSNQNDWYWLEGSNREDWKFIPHPSYGTDIRKWPGFAGFDKKTL